MKIGNLVTTIEFQGADCPGEYYRPIGIVYGQHSGLSKCWWIMWFSPERISYDRDCMPECELKVINESR